MLLDIEGNSADKYCSVAAVRKKIKIKAMIIVGVGGTILVYTRIFRLYGLYT